MFERFSIHQINAPSSGYYLSKVLPQRKGMCYAKVIHKNGKNRQLSEISKIMGT
jgi:hypothetical protein